MSAMAATRVPKWIWACVNACTHLVVNAPTDRAVQEIIEYENGTVRKTELQDGFSSDFIAGKRWLEWSINEISGTYGTSDWPGWHQIATDCGDDLRLFNMIRNRLHLAKCTRDEMLGLAGRRPQ